MRYFPAFIDIKEKGVVVIGQNPAAIAKAKLLSKAGGKVSLFKSHSGHETYKDIKNENFNVVKRNWSLEDLKDVFLIVASTESRTENKLISKYAKSLGVLINCVDQPSISNFTFPAIVERGDVVIGISTGGKAPVLARRLRAAIETVLPRNTREIAAFIGTFRDRIKEKLPQLEDRKRFWDNLLDGHLSACLEKGGDYLAQIEMESALNQYKKKLGTVYLVGAGPGDPELMTIKATQLLNRADVVIYDRLVSQEILDTARRDAKLVCVGKEKGSDLCKQHEINELLFNEASAGNLVVRLKGGDPFIFGRGGEELEYLSTRGITVSIVPGITAALGCGGAAEIPMTHRNYSSSVTFVTAYRAEGKSEINWQSLASIGGTIVFYMGVEQADKISKKLLGAGLSFHHPIAVIERGTTRAERVFRGTLGILPDIMKSNNISPPSVIIIGKVAKLGNKNTNNFELIDFPIAV